MTMRIAAALLLPAWAGAGCVAHAPLLHPDMPALGVAPSVAVPDHFQRDRAGSISEEGLRAILETPVHLDPTQRLGVVPVSDSYRPERAPPLPAVPAELTRSLDAAGLFQSTSEVSADWPVDGDVPGLRELAARYRSGYLLLYRHRFVEERYLNELAWLYPTVVGAIFARSITFETAGVLEATLFDVRSGTILFTVYQRVRGRSDETPWYDDRKMREMQARLVEEAAGKLAEQVVSKARRLVEPRS